LELLGIEELCHDFEDFDRVKVLKYFKNIMETVKIQDVCLNKSCPSGAGDVSLCLKPFAWA
jgi:hypothetical protein